MHILVAGGAGYIGSHAVKQLLEKTAHDVTIIDNLSTGHRSTLGTLEQISIIAGRGDLRFYRADLGNFRVVRNEPHCAGNPALLISDNTRAQAVLGWEPCYDDLKLICETALEWEKKI